MWFASVAVLALRYVTGIVPIDLIWCSRLGLLDLCCLTPSVCPLCAACLNVFGLHCVACSALIALLYLDVDVDVYVPQPVGSLKGS